MTFFDCQQGAFSRSHHVLAVRLVQDLVHGGPDLVLHGVRGLKEAARDAAPEQIRVDVVDRHLRVSQDRTSVIRQPDADSNSCIYTFANPHYKLCTDNGRSSILSLDVDLVRACV